MSDAIHDVHSKIRGIVAKQLSIDEMLIEPAKAFTDLGLDELDLSEIIMRLEEQFGVEISDEDAYQFMNVEAIETYFINKK